MSSSKSDPFLEKIKQYAVEELTIAEQGGGIGAGTSSAPGGNRKGVFGNLLLPHEWLQLDHAYAGASPSIPAEYKSLLEVTALAALLQLTYTLPILTGRGATVRPPCPTSYTVPRRRRDIKGGVI